MVDNIGIVPLCHDRGIPVEPAFHVSRSQRGRQARISHHIALAMRTFIELGYLPHVTATVLQHRCRPSDRASRCLLVPRYHHRQLSCRNRCRVHTGDLRCQWQRKAEMAAIVVTERRTRATDLISLLACRRIEESGANLAGRKAARKGDRPTIFSRLSSRILKIERNGVA